MVAGQNLATDEVNKLRQLGEYFGEREMDYEFVNPAC